MRIILLILTLVSLAAFVGCGSSNGDNEEQQSTVDIQNNRVSPKNITINAGSSVRWINLENTPQQVVSGTLVSEGSSSVIHQIVISNAGFSPQVSQIELGDTVRFSNTRNVDMNLNIVNDAGQVKDTVFVPQGGQVDFNFPSAGLFSIEDTSGLLFTATIIVFGAPNPDDNFRSVPLGTGDTFTFQFPTRGTYNYFIQNPTNPDQSFITGTVTVQ